MDQEIKKLKKIVKFMRNEGVMAVKMGDLEINLAPHATHPKPTQTEEKQSKLEAEAPFSDQDALFWSSDGIPEEALQ
jgi:hypothetical protein